MESEGQRHGPGVLEPLGHGRWAHKRAGGRFRARGEFISLGMFRIFRHS